MTNDELRTWAMKAWEKEVIRNLPAAKAARQLKASQVASRKALGRARRSLLAQQASTRRKLDKRASEIEQEFRGRREASDRELEEKRWQLLMGKE